MSLSYKCSSGKDRACNRWIGAIQQYQHIGSFSCGKIAAVIWRDDDSNAGFAAVYQVVDFHLTVNGIVKRKITCCIEGIQQGAAGATVILVENNGRNVPDIRVVHE